MKQSDSHQRFTRGLAMESIAVWLHGLAANQSEMCVIFKMLSPEQNGWNLAHDNSKTHKLISFYKNVDGSVRVYPIDNKSESVKVMTYAD